MKAKSAMQSSNHIGNIARKHADAVEKGRATTSQRKSKSSNSSFSSVPKHRAFVPMVTIWGGLFTALIIAVMPDYAIARTSALTGVYLPLVAVRLILAVGVGCAGALLGFIVSSALANHTKLRDGEAGLVGKAFKSRDFEPINPAADLGTPSLDAPFEPDLDDIWAQAPQPKPAQPALPEPTLGELAQRGYDIEEPVELEDTQNSDDDADDWADEAGDRAFTRKHFAEALIESCEGARCEPAPSDETVEPHIAPSAEAESSAAESADTGFASLSAEQITPQRKPLSEKREALDLSEFSTAPERDAEVLTPPQEHAQAEPEAEAEAETQTCVPPQTKAPATALEALRQKPADELSLVEMVERFAAALHDHQAQERARFEHGKRNRDAALVEALKALTLFTDNGFDKAEPANPAPGLVGQTEDELRNALTRLQGLRGAA